MLKNENLDNLITKGVLLGVFLLPIKLSLAYGAILSSLALHLYSKRKNILSIFSGMPTCTIAPILAWTVCVFLSGLLGISIYESIYKGIRFGASLLIVPLVFFAAKNSSPIKILTALLLGQTVSSTHTIISGLLPLNLTRILPGEVTESGQLAISCVAGVGCLFLIFFKNQELKVSRSLFLLAGLNLICLSTVGFYGALLSQLELLSIVSFLIISFCFIALKVYKNYPNLTPNLYLILGVILPIIFSALLINLKRGPWIGVSVALIFIFMRYSKKFVLPIIALIIITAAAVPPIHQRLMNSSDDFFIAGGRNTMWSIGIELVAKYPLGIGFQNSPILRKYDPSIPDMHEHFHNNLLNILVETGWLGLLIFCIWICGMLKGALRSGLQQPDSFLAYTLAGCIISWQVAGLVEYNFGDSEVLLTAFVIIGILASVLSNSDKIDKITWARSL